jgi:hypothetical protein
MGLEIGKGTGAQNYDFADVQWMRMTPQERDILANKIRTFLPGRQGGVAVYYRSVLRSDSKKHNVINIETSEKQDNRFNDMMKNEYIEENLLHKAGGIEYYEATKHYNAALMNCGSWTAANFLAFLGKEISSMKVSSFGTFFQKIHFSALLRQIVKELSTALKPGDIHKVLKRHEDIINNMLRDIAKQQSDQEEILKREKKEKK